MVPLLCEAYLCPPHLSSVGGSPGDERTVTPEAQVGEGCVSDQPILGVKGGEHRRLEAWKLPRGQSQGSLHCSPLSHPLFEANKQLGSYGGHMETGADGVLSRSRRVVLTGPVSHFQVYLNYGSCCIRSDDQIGGSVLICV